MKRWTSPPPMAWLLVALLGASGAWAQGSGKPGSPPGKNSRHALIISISRFADPKTSPLPGAAEDRQSAAQIARAMQVPDDNISYLQDEQATGDNIRRAIAALNTRVQDGDRVFIHYSGHGTRFPDPEAGGCAEALSTYDGGTWKGMVLHKEMAQLLQPIVLKTDKLFVMYDACHSGGLLSQMPKPRSAADSPVNDNGEGALRGRFTETSESCARPSNVRPRSLLDEATAQGAFPQDVVFLSAARPDEVSLEDQKMGGLATQFVRDCLLRDAVDLDGSGAISMDEIQQCAQTKINQRLKNDSLFTPHHLLLSGNRKFVPAWFSQALPAQQVPGAPATGVLNAVAQTPPVTPPAATPALPQTLPPTPQPTATTTPSSPPGRRGAAPDTGRGPRPPDRRPGPGPAVRTARRQAPGAGPARTQQLAHWPGRAGPGRAVRPQRLRLCGPGGLGQPVADPALSQRARQQQPDRERPAAAAAPPALAREGRRPSRHRHPAGDGGRRPTPLESPAQRPRQPLCPQPQ
nr:caspase family protein [Curvibacter lanceolatus]